MATKTPISIKTPLYELTLKASPDGLKLFLDATRVAPTGEVHRKDLLESITPSLSQSAQPDLIDVGVLDDIAAKLSKGEACLERRIAKGVAAVPGENGRVAVLVKCFNGKGAPTTAKDGTIDFRSLHLFDNVTAGAIVAKLFPPTLGTHGHDCFGNVLNAVPGKAAKPSVDKSISLERVPKEELECLVSNLEGYPFDDGGKLCIRPELKFSGDVDLKTGSIDFIGTLVITGDVAPGFFAKAKAGVIINGGIRDAIAESAKGDVTIKGFAFGGPAGRVLAGGAVSIFAAQELKVEAIGDLLLTKHATDCVLRSHRVIQAKAASIVGGECYAVCGLEVAELGNEAGKRTVVYLCNTVEADPAFGALLGTIANHVKAITMIEGHLGPYAKNYARIQLLKPPFREKMEALSLKLRALQSSLVTLEERKKKAIGGAIRSDIQRINVLKCAHAGVEVICDSEIMILKDAIPGPVSIDFDPVQKKFSHGPLQGLICNLPANNNIGDKGHEKGK